MEKKTDGSYAVPPLFSPGAKHKDMQDICTDLLDVVAQDSSLESVCTKSRVRKPKSTRSFHSLILKNSPNSETIKRKNNPKQTGRVHFFMIMKYWYLR